MTAPLQACFVDLAEEDIVSPAQIAQLQLAGPPWSGVGLQCSNGARNFATWFNPSWKAARSAPTYGTSTFRFPYHYFVVGIDPIVQADVALDAVSQAGGWGIGDLWLGVDIERGEQPANVTASQVEAGISAFCDRIMAETGRRVVLYAGSYTRDLGIKSRMGCWALWYPQWGGGLNLANVRSMGFDLDSLLLWQTVGDGSNTAPPGYPHTTPIGNHLDISVLVRGNLPYAQGLDWVRTHAGGQPL